MNKTHLPAAGKRLLSLLLCLLVVCSLSVTALTPAQAKDNRAKISSLSFGRRVKGDSFKWDMNAAVDGVWYYPLYKIKVPKDGYLTLTNHLAGQVGFHYFYLYRTEKDFLADKLDYGNRTVFKSIQVKKTTVIPVKKGTYYVHAEGWGDNVIGGKRYDFELKFTARAADKNLTRAKATALKSGARAAVNVPSGGSVTRWFKITLPKAKKLTISWNNRSGVERTASAALYNAKGQAVSVTGKGVSSFSTAKLAKGTYYLRVRFSGMGSYQVSWK